MGRELSRSDDARRPDGPPTTAIATRYGTSRLPLGLDGRFALLGGDRLGPGGVTSEVPLDWIAGLHSTVAAACRRQVDEGRPWFHLPPTALVGKRGVGRTHVARQLARYAGVPFLEFDVSIPGALGPDEEARFAIDAYIPPKPVLGIAATGCANPMVLVTGTDQAAPAVLSRLATMIDRATSRRWTCEPLGAVLDLGGITWLVSTDHADALHPSVHSRLDWLHVDYPASPSARALRSFGIALEALSDLEIEPDQLIAERTLRVLHDGGRPVSIDRSTRLPGRRVVADEAARSIYEAATHLLVDGARE